MARAPRSTDERRSLPQSREGLHILATVVEAFLEAGEQHQAVQRAICATLDAARLAPTMVPDNSDLLTNIRSRSNQRRVDDFPSFDILLPYLNIRELRRLDARRRTAHQRLQQYARRRMPAALAVVVPALAEEIDAFEGMLVLFRQLQVEIVAAFDACADAGADTLRRAVRVVPRNDLVIRLYFAIEGNTDPARSQRDIAMEFTHEHGGNPDSLLREIRRFRNRLNPPNR